MPPISNRKRPGLPSSAGGSATKKKKTRPGAVAVKIESGFGGSRPIGAAAGRPRGAKTAASAAANEEDKLKERFIRLFSEPQYAAGISNAALKEKFGKDYTRLAPIINELTGQSRLVMSKLGDSLHYSLVADDVAAKFSGLDSTARMVYQVIERAGNMGIWTRDIRHQTNLQNNPTLANKIFKALESRQLIKPVKSVHAKQKKLYMLYNLQPAKELTGGVWYSDLEFDHEFISALRDFVLNCVRRLNGGKGVTLAEIREKMIQGKVSRVELSLEEVQQLVQTLIYDYMVEETAATSAAAALHAHSQDDITDAAFLSSIKYVASRRVTPMCEFRWWDAVEPDFHFRAITFEDGVTLPPHEHHYHTA